MSGPADFGDVLDDVVFMSRCSADLAEVMSTLGQPSVSDDDVWSRVLWHARVMAVVSERLRALAYVNLKRVRGSSGQSGTG